MRKNFVFAAVAGALLLLGSLTPSADATWRRGGVVTSGYYAPSTVYYGGPVYSSGYSPGFSTYSSGYSSFSPGFSTYSSGYNSYSPGFYGSNYYGGGFNNSYYGSGFNNSYYGSGFNRNYGGGGFYNNVGPGFYGRNGVGLGLGGIGGPGFRFGW